MFELFITIYYLSPINCLIQITLEHKRFVANFASIPFTIHMFISMIPQSGRGLTDFATFCTSYLTVLLSVVFI